MRTSLIVGIKYSLFLYQNISAATYSSARKRLTLMDEICTDGGKQFDKFIEDDLIIVRAKFMDHEEVYYFVIWCLDSQQMC